MRFLRSLKQLLGVGPLLLIIGLALELATVQLTGYITFEFTIVYTVRIGMAILLLGLLIAGMIWFNLTLKLIKVNFKGEKKQLIIKGPFAYVRHPLYAVISLTLPPLFIIWNQDLLFLFSWIVILVMVHFVVKIEEIGLLHEFGSSYKNYKHYVPAILPFKGASGKKHFHDIIK